jgi:hypothetical protein
MIPLEDIQPSLVALLQAYLHAFPMILEYHCNFLVKVIKFTGLALIQQIQSKLKNSKGFDNSDTYQLQLAKNLLTMPEQSVRSIFGMSEAEIVSSVTNNHKVPQPQKEQKLVPLYYEKTRLRGC